MTHRFLPPSEWERLAGTELETVWPHFPTNGTVRVIVVENEQGQIRGCWSVFPRVDAEGVWVHPEDRKHGSVARHLLAGMREALTDIGAASFVTSAVSDEVRTIIAGLGGTKIPGDHYLVPMKGAICHS
jgi:hypothetical protein